MEKLRSLRSEAESGCPHSSICLWLEYVGMVVIRSESFPNSLTRKPDVAVALVLDLALLFLSILLFTTNARQLACLTKNQHTPCQVNSEIDSFENAEAVVVQTSLHS